MWDLFSPSLIRGRFGDFEQFLLLAQFMNGRQVAYKEHFPFVKYLWKATDFIKQSIFPFCLLASLWELLFTYCLSPGCRHNIPQTRQHNRNLFLRILEVGKSKIVKPANSVPGENCLLGLQMMFSFSLCPYMGMLVRQEAYGGSWRVGVVVRWRESTIWCLFL